METLALIKCFPTLHLSGVFLRLIHGGTGSHHSSFCEMVVGASLPFNPIKLVLLIAWVYLCLYCIQRVQFSPLIPKNRKSIANFATLFLGPIILLALMIVEATKKYQEGDSNILKIITKQIQDVFSTIKTPQFAGLGHEPAIKLFDSSGKELKEIYGHIKTKRTDRHILDLTEQIVFDALKERASDILIDPRDESTYRIRLRIDGVLTPIDQIDADTCQAVINSIKAVSGMDISEKRRPQDGAFVAKTASGTASFRVASAGALNGEKLSVRVLNQNMGSYDLNNIGLSEKQRLILKDAVTKPFGMVLMCGPTGSGKTTTLYAMLNEIDFLTRNVITVEDPIEYVLPNASQIEVNPRADITFAKSLRSILRQDPDVICVGEIRDEETAAIALRASQTGHLVLATVHSNSTASALIRLLDLGASPLLLSTGLSLIVSQRLVRRLCNKCKRPAQLSQSQIYDLRRKGINYKAIFQAAGCSDCRNTGYRGRIGIYDILPLDDKLRDNIANNELPVTQLRKEGDQRGRSNLKKQGIKMVVTGLTSLEELDRVLG